MILQMLFYRCDPFGHHFNTAELPFNSYGQFLLRDETGTSLAYVDTFSDPTFTEVADLLKGLAEIGPLTANQRADVLQRLYGDVACDPNVDGRPFRIGQRSRCPVCSSTIMRCWDEVVPVEVVDVDVPIVTHVNWELLTENQKVESVKRWLLVNRR